MQKLISLLSLPPLLLLSGCVLAQELSLFEPVETQPTDDKAVQQQSGLVNQNGQPAYTLRSSTRIGDSYAVELLDRQGKLVKVKWHQGERAPIPGAGGFVIEDIQQRNVIIAQPGNDPCVNTPAKGVNCLDAARARLSMTIAAVLPPTAQGIQPPAKAANANNAGAPNQGPVPQNPFEAAIQAQQAQAAANGGQAVFVNPFTGKTETVDQPPAAEQAARDARQRARSDRLNRFEPERIPDNQVPAGMRRVTTPFGDRLVPAGK